MSKPSDSVGGHSLRFDPTKDSVSDETEMGGNLLSGRPCSTWVSPVPEVLFIARSLWHKVVQNRFAHTQYEASLGKSRNWKERCADHADEGRKRKLLGRKPQGFAQYRLRIRRLLSRHRNFVLCHISSISNDKAFSRFD